MYVDQLILQDYASYTNHSSTNSLPTLNFNTNMVIYYADAQTAGVGEFSWQINGMNGNHLRWISNYVGHFSFTNLIYPDATTNTFNIGLVKDPFVDSDGDGHANNVDPTPIPESWSATAAFSLEKVKVIVYPTNSPAKAMAVEWNTIPNATNTVMYSTNMLAQGSPNWMVLTNFVSSATNSMIFDPMVSPGRYYQVKVSPKN
jgi:hypothetical protein